MKRVFQIIIDTIVEAVEDYRIVVYVVVIVLLMSGADWLFNHLPK